MRPISSPLALLLATAVLGTESLTTDYGRVRTLRVESTSKITLETTSFEMTVDGEPMDRPFGGGGSELSRTVVQLDRFLASEDGEPTHVRRTFEAITSDSVSSRRDEDVEESHDCPLGGVALELTVDEDGEVTAELIEGDAPDDDALLEGHSPNLFLDALLPEEDAEEGDGWSLEHEAVLAALTHSLDPRLFPAPEREGPTEAGGRRGGFRGRGGDALGFLREAEWEGEATLIATDAEHEGVSCFLIELELEASGELPEFGFGGGGGRRGRIPGGAVPGPAALAGEFLVELEGRLLFSKEGRHPLLLELEGTVSTDRTNEFERQGSTMSMHVAQEGTFTHTVTISEEEE